MARQRCGGGGTMIRNVAGFVIAWGLLSLWLAEPADARVVRIVVERTSPYAGGRTFGESGSFERLEGTVYMEVDPSDPLNAVIVNLDKAPRTEDGRVEFSAPFVIIKPVDLARGNRKIYYGVNNRGNTTEIPFQNFPGASRRARRDAPESGDGLFFRRGFTFVDAGWAGDIAPTATRLGANLPVAVQPDGSPIVARIRIEYKSDDYTLPLKGNSGFVSYETADTGTSRSALTVRDAIDGTRTPVADDRWAFGACPTGRGSFVPSTTDICVFDGFRRDHIYELTYPAKNPWVMGLGYAVTRDLASFLRYRTEDDAGNPNPLAESRTTVGVERAYGFGISSTGMYMRDFLYLGFNEDEAHQPVFDAVRIHIPGTHRLFANTEFADPNVYSGQDQYPDFLSHSYPPLTYAVTTDPISGIRDGILKRPETDPFVFHIDTAHEFWQMNASLNVHDGEGNPVPVPDNVRLYYLSSHSHLGASGVAARPTETGSCRNATNGGLSYATVLRALLVALDEWADRGIEPPGSNYPDIRNGTLGTPAEAADAFPSIPGVAFPTVINGLELLDYGPTFGPRGGRLTVLPPGRGPRYTVLVPKPDADGHDVAGIRTVDIAVPVGTNTGWNLREAGPREKDLCGLQGSFLPFSTTRAERLVSGDPRPSLEERYGDHQGFVRAVDEAVRDLVRRRFLLEEDGHTIVKAAEESDILP